MLLLLLLLDCCRYVATELPVRYRKLVANTSRCCVVVAALWTAAFVTFMAPLPTKPDWIYYRYNVNQKMCGLHWEYPSPSVMPSISDVKHIVTTNSFIRSVRKRLRKEENMMMLALGYTGSIHRSASSVPSSFRYCLEQF